MAPPSGRRKQTVFNAKEFADGDPSYVEQRGIKCQYMAGDGRRCQRDAHSEDTLHMFISSCEEE